MKKLMFPQEFDVWYILPAIRKKLALKLIENGMLQKEVAKIMNISSATITHYKTEKRVKKDFIGNEVDHLIEKSVKEILIDNNKVASEITHISKHLKKNQNYCDLFQKLSGRELNELPCSNCDKDKSCM